MPTFQTQAQKKETIIIGSVKAEVSLDDVVYENIGLGRSFQLTENITPFNVQADNGPDPIEGVAEHELEISFEMLELYLPNLDKIRGGIDTLSEITGASASATDQYASGATQENQFYEFSKQGDGTEPTVTVTQDPEGTPEVLTAGTSYEVIQDAQSRWGFVFIGGAYVQAENHDVKVVYTELAARTLSTGGKTTIEPRYWKFTNRKLVNGSIKNRIFKVYSASLMSGLAMAFASDNADDPITPVPVSLTGKLDTSRTEGDQLFIIEDQVGVN